MEKNYNLSANATQNLSAIYSFVRRHLRDSKEFMEVADEAGKLLDGLSYGVLSYSFLSSTLCSMTKAYNAKTIFPEMNMLAMQFIVTRISECKKALDALVKDIDNDEDELFRQYELYEVSCSVFLSLYDRIGIRDLLSGCVLEFLNNTLDDKDIVYDKSFRHFFSSFSIPEGIDDRSVDYSMFASSYNRMKLHAENLFWLLGRS